jgi:hypothetical protein
MTSLALNDELITLFSFYDFFLTSLFYGFYRKGFQARASARVDKFSKSDIIVSPSILSANFAKLGDQVCGDTSIQSSTFRQTPFP